jgi:hypothetical protein
MTSTVDHRAELIADLRHFADLLERRPDMLLAPHSYARIQYTVSGDDDTAVAEVERMAEVLGVEVERGPSHATARLTSGRVEYVVHASTSEGKERWNAAISYAVAPGPDMAVSR